VVPPGLPEMRGQLDARVAIGRGGKIEGALGRQPGRRQRGRTQDQHQDQRGHREYESFRPPSCRDGELDTENVELVGYQFAFDGQGVFERNRKLSNGLDLGLAPVTPEAAGSSPSTRQ
jgi:hypothetical protein